MTKQEEENIDEYCDWVFQNLKGSGEEESGEEELIEEDISNWFEQDLPVGY